MSEVGTLSRHRRRASDGVRVAYLDGIRGVAILSVLCVHLLAPYLPGFKGGYIGVDLFFVLSGYIITSILVTRSTTYLRFLRARVRRLYPPLLGLLIVGAVLAAIIPGTPIKTGDAVRSAAIAALQLSAPWLATSTEHLNPFGVTWSLALEWYFYLIWPLIVYALKRRSATVATCAKVCLGASAVLYLAAASMLNARWFYFGPLSRSAELLLGAAVSYLLLAAPRGSPAVPVSARYIGACGGITAIAVWTLTSPDEFSNIYRWLMLPIASLAAVCFILLGHWWPNDVLSRILSWRPLSGLGGISYSLYLWHSVPLTLLGRGALHLSQAARGALGMVLVAVLTGGSYLLLERSGRRSRGDVLAPARDLAITTTTDPS